MVPCHVRWVFDEHADDSCSQQPQHSKQADVFPQVLVNHTGTPAQHFFDVIKESSETKSGQLSELNRFVDICIGFKILIFQDKKYGRRKKDLTCRLHIAKTH